MNTTSIYTKRVNKSFGPKRGRKFVIVVATARLWSIGVPIFYSNIANMHIIYGDCLRTIVSLLLMTGQLRRHQRSSGLQPKKT